MHFLISLFLAFVLRAVLNSDKEELFVCFCDIGFSDTVTPASAFKVLTRAPRIIVYSASQAILLTPWNGQHVDPCQCFDQGTLTLVLKN